MSTHRFLHPSLPRRPARTSQTREPFEFHRRPLQSGVERVIVVLVATSPISEPVVSIQHLRAHQPVGRIMIPRSHVATVRPLIAELEQARPTRRVAFLPTGWENARIRCWTAVDRGERLLVFGRETFSGEHLGRTTTLTPDDVDALKRALDWLEQNA